MTTKVSDYRHDLGLKKVKVKYICKNYLNSSCNVSRNFLLRHLSKTYPMKSIQEHLRQLLQIFSTAKMLQVPLCLDSLFEQFKQSANKPRPRCQSKRYIAPPKFNKLKRPMTCSNIMEIAPARALS